jgi:hypothetical protein
LDNGKIRIYTREGIPVVEIYHDGEIDLPDVVWVHHTLFNHLEPPLHTPTDIIIDRVGSYSFSTDSYMAVTKLMEDSNRVAFVIHHAPQETIVDLAASTYLSSHEVTKFYSVDDAFDWLSGKVLECSHSV